jgi:hypothetical protein
LGATSAALGVPAGAGTAGGFIDGISQASSEASGAAGAAIVGFSSAETDSSSGESFASSAVVTGGVGGSSFAAGAAPEDSTWISFLQRRHVTTTPKPAALREYRSSESL